MVRGRCGLFKMEVTPQEEEEGQSSTGKPSVLSIFSRLNIPFLIVAAITGLVATNSDPWWTISSAQSTNILQANVSPFFVRITGVGIPSTVANADTIGLITRILMGLTAIALAWQGFFPMSVWRKPVLWLSLSALAGVFLSFALLVHSTQLILFQQFGVMPGLTGDVTIPGVVLGTDLVAYQSPIISSTLALPFFGGLAGFLVLGGMELAQTILFPRLALSVSELMTGLTGAFLSPPYQHTWLTSDDQGMNPLAQDPDRLTDDQLAISFERLLKALQPGATVSVILPPWATRLSNRLARVVSWTGFELENSQVIFRTPGRPENELVFRKPVISQKTDSESSEASELAAPEEPSSPEQDLTSVGVLDNSLGTDGDLSSDLYQPGKDVATDGPPVDEEIEDPVWAQPELSPVETAIIASALKMIERTNAPIRHEDLVDEICEDLVNENVSFDSVGQVEDVLVSHEGKEFTAMEQLDETGTDVVRFWWLGELGRSTEPAAKTRLRSGFSSIRKRIGKIGSLLESNKQTHEDQAWNDALDDEGESQSALEDEDESQPAVEDEDEAESEN